MHYMLKSKSLRTVPSILFFTWVVLGFFGLSTAQQTPVPPDAHIKESVVAGGFYPADPVELAREIDGYIEKAEPKLEKNDRPVALIVPHAGIFYSGPVAGYSYKLLRDIQPRTVILVGPSHQARFKGISVYDRGYFRTPLGLLPVDTILARQIGSTSKDIYFFPDAFAREHNIEVQLPFLQRACPDVKIVPLVMGTQSPDEVHTFITALVDVLKKSDAFLIASTDLSHFHPADQAIKLDQVCLNDVKKLDGESLLNHLGQGKTEMCGGGPTAAVILTARALGADVGRILKYGDSGDVGPKDKSAVVGYLAAALVDTGAVPMEKTASPTKGEKMTLSDAQKKLLLTVARGSIEHYLKTGTEKTWTNTDPDLDVPSGAFVTLKKRGQLRGCIGHVEATSPLFETVAQCAVSSAVRDPRFPPVNANELPELHLEISVMTPPTPIAGVEEIVIGRDGLIIEKGYNRGLLLPQVPVEWGWDRDEFLVHLCRKAGLGPDEWKSGATIYSFQALVFGEE